MKSCAVVGVGVQVLLGAWLFGASVAGCGGEGTPQPQSADAAPLAEAPLEPVEAPPADTPADPEPLPAPAAEQKPEAPPAKDPNAPREVKYVVTPEGLKVEVAGVRFLVTAEAKQIARGWGAKVSVKAEATDGKEHVLLNPKSGPLAFAAAVFKKGSTEAERIGDSRQGDGELSVGAGSTTFSRDFPHQGGRVLAIGETLDLEVALWGLGETKEDRRPVKQLVHVKMKVDKGKPKAIVEPPASAK